MPLKGTPLTRAQKREIQKLFEAGTNIGRIRKEMGLKPRVYLARDIIAALGFSSFDEYHEALAAKRRRPAIPVAVKREVNQRCEDRCVICTSTDQLSTHHIVQRVDGGSDDPDNLILLCKHCHKSIHDGIVGYLRRYQLILEGMAIESEIRYCNSCKHHHINITNPRP